ncbi:unnamed protein product [Calypogeia fissa]
MEECSRLLHSAKAEAASIVEDARAEGRRVLDVKQKQCVEMEERRNALRQRLIKDEACFECQQRAGNCDESSLPLDPEAVALFRIKDAARKKDAYWKMKQQCQGIPGADVAVIQLTADDSEFPNRKSRSLNHVVSLAATHIMSKLQRFNDKSKKLFFERFWKHRSLKQFQPGGVGIEPSVLVAIVDLKQTLHIVKNPRRKDHLSTKRSLLTALVGQSTVGSRGQTALARYLGIKRHNLYRASKTRQLLDADLSVKYPMGERKLRSDKISEEV